MTKSFKEMQGIKEACWVGYKQVGMKKKGDRMVPNCVKEEVVDAVFVRDVSNFYYVISFSPLLPHRHCPRTFVFSCVFRRVGVWMACPP